MQSRFLWTRARPLTPDNNAKLNEYEYNVFMNDFEQIALENLITPNAIVQCSVHTTLSTYDVCPVFGTQREKRMKLARAVC